MFHKRYLFYAILIQHLISGTPQINLYYTDDVSEYDNNNIVLQHHCFRIIISTKDANIIRQIISYCMSESFSKFNIEKDKNFPRFSFDELAKQNISSQQLYDWSASIDTIEDYQDYLNQSSKLNNVSFEEKFFYNCTMPRFGPLCQYEFLYYHSNSSSLYEIIHDFYHNYEYKSTNLTCYTHLKCNRGHFPACLDWSEICDGKVDCIDGNFDEEHCWQLELNECKDNEYQCSNGQCIPKSFFRDDSNNPDCLDGSDEVERSAYILHVCRKHELTFGCEDRTCQNTPLTSSCVIQRQYLLMETMYSIKDNSISNECWSAFKCLLSIPDSKYPFYDNLCPEIVQNTCPDMFYIPNIPVLFGHIYTAYTKEQSKYLGNWALNPPYICYNNSHYDDLFDKTSKILFNNTICFRPKLSQMVTMMSFTWDKKYYKHLNNFYFTLKELGRLRNFNLSMCNKSNTYQCINSTKCIPMYRYMDNIFDCPYKDDENSIIDYITEEIKENYYQCKATNKYIHINLIKNGHCDCGMVDPPLCEDEDLNYIYSRINISFQTICDGFTELIPININGQNSTDETECEIWECNNIYTHCDGIWNCINGEDELNCNLSSLLLNCSLNEHICISPYTYKLMCLSISKVHDGYIDCFGGTDEPRLCSTMNALNLYSNFHCMNQSMSPCILMPFLCNGRKDCDYEDDELFCVKNRTYSIVENLCHSRYTSSASDMEKFLCHYFKPTIKDIRKYFSFDEMNKTVEKQTKISEISVLSSSSSINMSNQYKPRCHRGLDLRVWLNNKKNLTKDTCFCPPNYYDSQCQYQNERISLTLKFRALSNSWQTLFEIIISLIDNSDQRIIHSYEQFTYLSIRDCNNKFNIYLIYSTRPKNQLKNYSIHIDIYEKISLIYRASLLFTINFSFLPVHRLSYIINIPESNNNLQSCSNNQCNHGKCIIYSNNNHMNYCQCERGWDGRYCNISYQCKCSFDSLCIGINSNNRSICICPINKIGSRCFIPDTLCQNNTNSTCKNNGQCIPDDEYMITSKKNFRCICPIGFSGDRCEIIDNKIVISFSKDIISSQSIYIHFIEVIKNNIPIRSTSFKRISPIENSVIINWSQRFHLIFIEFIDKTYYLTYIQKLSNQSISIIKRINSSDNCPHINKLFNKTFIEFHLIRRIKYYHIPCQNISLNLSCFHDDDHLCLCYNSGQKRLSNCFNFDHNMTFNCLGQSECQNSGQCFQDQPNCPQRSMCICRPCYYGSRCQFSTSGFGLSLDGILGYHIIPNNNIKHQSFIVKFSLILTIIFILIGFINGLFALITFKNKIVREVGCGLYLLGSSITTLIIMILFGLKFSILILTQMKILSNELFIQIQCILLDYLLQIFLNMNQWLNACVATERAITAIKGTKFIKIKSKKAARLVIIILIIFIISTSIYDPIYRRLIIEENNDDEEKRIWCIITYPSSLKIFNSIMHTFHFFSPFIINFISSIILITKKTDQKSNVQTHRTYKQILKEQFHQHKHLFTAPIILVILAIPRLIIVFISKCMKSINHAWIFLIAYFISFIPSMITFIIFILPSKFYKKQFRKSIIKYRTNLQQRLRLFL